MQLAEEQEKLENNNIQFKKEKSEIRISLNRPPTNQLVEWGN